MNALAPYFTFASVTMDMDSDTVAYVRHEAEMNAIHELDFAKHAYAMADDKDVSAARRRLDAARKELALFA